MAAPVRALAFVLLLLPTVALAQTQQYLPQATMEAALARSATQCTAMGCDGVNTKYWWATVALQNGTAAVVIEASGPYGPTGLTAAEQAALVPYATMCSQGLLKDCAP